MLSVRQQGAVVIEGDIAVRVVRRIAQLVVVAFAAGSVVGWVVVTFGVEPDAVLGQCDNYTV